MLDMEEDKGIPLIMSCPFLTIGQTLIDVVVGEQIMRVNNEKTIFNIFKTMNTLSQQMILFQ